MDRLIASQISRSDINQEKKRARQIKDFAVSVNKKIDKFMFLAGELNKLRNLMVM